MSSVLLVLKLIWTFLLQKKRIVATYKFCKKQTSFQIPSKNALLMLLFYLLNNANKDDIHICLIRETSQGKMFLLFFQTVYFQNCFAMFTSNYTVWVKCDS